MSYSILPNGHHQLITELGASNQELLTKNFWGLLTLALGDWSDTLDGIGKIRPDLFKIDSSANVVELYEVEVTHPVDAEKIKKIARLSLALDDIGWELTLTTVGQFRQQARVDLCPYVMELFVNEN